MDKGWVHPTVRNLAIGVKYNSLGQNLQEKLNFLLISSLSWLWNPACGFYRDAQRPCTCAAALVTKYQKRISGPLLNRIGIHYWTPTSGLWKTHNDRVGESSASIRQRVQVALINRRIMVWIMLYLISNEDIPWCLLFESPFWRSTPASCSVGSRSDFTDITKQGAVPCSQ